MKAIYVRVSTEEQATKGYSIQDQLRRCKEKAGMDSEIREYVDDGYSGEFLERPALERLRKDIRDGLIEEVIVYDPDRLSRKLMHQLILTEEIEKYAKLTFVNTDYEKTPEGMLFYQMRGAIAEFEKAKIRERMIRGKIEKAKQGKVVRDAGIYGYKYNKEIANYEIYEPEAKVVRLIFDLFTNPRGRVQGINGIAKYLTERGYPTKKRKGVWHRQVVRQILMNETYTGIHYQRKWNTEGMLGNKYKPKEERIQQKLRPKEEWIPVKVPAIIDRKTFELAQKLLKESRRRWAGRPKRKYLLSGLLRCGDCGNTMTGRRTKNWGTYIFMYSDEKNTAGAKYEGCGNRVKCEDLDKFVWDTFVELITTKGKAAAETAATVEDSVDLEKHELEHIKEELERIKSFRQRLIRVMVENSDVIDEDDIRQQLVDLKEREERLKETQKELEKALENRQYEEYSEEIFEDTVKEFLQIENPDSLPIERKQEFLRKVFREIRVYSNGEIKFIRM